MRGRRYALRLAVTCLAFAIIVVAAPAGVSASFPGRDGSVISVATDFDTGVVSLVSIDPGTGAAHELLADSDNYLDYPRYSPDGDSIVFTRIPKAHDADGEFIWIADADGSDQRLVGRGSALDFSPSGARILFATEQRDLAMMNTDGSHRRIILKRNELTRRDNSFFGTAAWSPTGEWIVYDIAKDRSGPSKRNLYIAHPNGSGKTPLPSLSKSYAPDWSPDGKTVAYTRDGLPPVVLALKLNADRPRRVKRDAYNPVYSPSGRKLLFGRVDDLFTMPSAGGVATKVHVPSIGIDPGYTDWQSLP